MSHRLWDIVSGWLVEFFQKTYHAPPINPYESGDETAKMSTERQAKRNERACGLPFEYEPLKRDGYSIRLLKLLPGERQDDIVCKLSISSLMDLPESYEALSYVWGDITELVQIQVNARTLHIGMNLYIALRDLRSPTKPRTLWVDAVCIDQTQPTERNHQVGIMANIFRKASRTIVYLGPEINGSTEAEYAMLDELAGEAVARGHEVSQDLTLSLLDGKLIESPLYHRYRGDATITHLAGSTWWSRAWTIQEILLASEAIGMTGTHTMEWNRLCLGAEYGLVIGIWIPVLLGMMIDKSVVPFLSFHALRQKRRQQYDILSVSKLPAVCPAQELLELLFYCRFRNAKEPRDKIYSLLGLQSAEQDYSMALGIEPDYSAPIDRVYINAARQIILRCDNLDVLGTCLTKTSSVLPSWVTDWSDTGPTPRPLMHDFLGRRRTTHATSHTKLSVSFSDDDHGRTLIVSGHEVTTITNMATTLRRLHIQNPDLPSFHKGEGLLKRLTKMILVIKRLPEFYLQLTAVVPQVGTLSDWEAFACASPTSNPVPALQLRHEEDKDGDITVDPNSCDPLSVYWRTLCAGAQVPEGGAAETAELFYNWRTVLWPIMRLHRWHLDGFLRTLSFLWYIQRTWSGFNKFSRLLEMVYERRLGRAENGFLLLLPAGAEPGDKVFLVKGSRVPLVLRPQKKSSFFRFVGEAYVEGIMNGELFRPEDCIDLKIN